MINLCKYCTRKDLCHASFNGIMKTKCVNHEQGYDGCYNCKHYLYKENLCLKYFVITNQEDCCKAWKAKEVKE